MNEMCLEQTLPASHSSQDTCNKSCSLYLWLYNAAFCLHRGDMQLGR